jgi:hypothetical protein
MEIYRGGLPQTVLDWAEPTARSLAGLKLADLDPFLFFLGLALALAAWRAQRSWLRGFLGEWRVARLLRLHGLEARHDVLLPHPEGTGWTQVDHLVRLPPASVTADITQPRSVSSPAPSPAWPVLASPWRLARR